MKIALDYDNTYTLAPQFWEEFIHNAYHQGHKVRIVTARCSKLDNIDHLDWPVLYCDGKAKREVCRDIYGWEPDIWIDDHPENISQDSIHSEEWLAEWRAKR